MLSAIKKTTPSLDDLLYMALIHAPQSRWLFVSMRIDTGVSVVVYCLGLFAMCIYIALGLKRRYSRQL